MIFGKIDFINLLPFYIYVKKYKSIKFNQILNHKKSYPSKINQLFKNKKIDGAFISSIKSQKNKCFDMGIVAKKDVMSVFIKKGIYKKDSQSDTSNVLAQVLNIQGEIIIGDKALSLYKDDAYIDLALLWYQKYHLPFVFARFCINKHKIFYFSGGHISATL